MGPDIRLSRPFSSYYKHVKRMKGSRMLMAHACNPSLLGRLRWGGPLFKVEVRELPRPSSQPMAVVA
jgi:hypothetical protein